MCGGEACIDRTRILVCLLEQARSLGATEQALLGAYPSLCAEDLVGAWCCTRTHPAEIEVQIRDNEVFELSDKDLTRVGRASATMPLA